MNKRFVIVVAVIAIVVLVVSALATGVALAGSTPTIVSPTPIQWSPQVLSKGQPGIISVYAKGGFGGLDWSAKVSKPGQIDPVRVLGPNNALVSFYVPLRKTAIVTVEVREKQGRWPRSNSHSWTATSTFSEQSLAEIPIKVSVLFPNRTDTGCNPRFLADTGTDPYQLEFHWKFTLNGNGIKLPDTWENKRDTVQAPNSLTIGQTLTTEVEVTKIDEPGAKGHDIVKFTC